MTKEEKERKEAEARVNKERGDTKQDVLERDNKDLDRYVEALEARGER